MMYWSRVAAATTLFLLAETVCAARAYLPYEQLVDGLPRLTATVPLDVAFVADPSSDEAPTDTFEGTLRITSSSVSTPWTNCNTTIVPGGCDDAYRFPSGRNTGIDLVQNGRDILPVRRDPIALSSTGWWDLIVQPGRVWKEAADHGYTRVAIPFALEEKNANCMQNGVMMFLFRTNGKPGISKVAIEIATETCLYNRFDMVGLLSATYTPKVIGNKATIIANFAAEVAARIPTRPVSQLPQDFPQLGLDPAKLRIGNPAHNTLYGLLLKHNGTYTHYVSECKTRNGNYPYCDALVLPSYSTAKSVYAGVALMRLQALDPTAKDELISHHVDVPRCSSSSAGTWWDVSFSNALDMATGNFASSAYTSDEDFRMSGLFAATTNADKLKFSWCNFPRTANPGSVFAYHSSDTFIAGRAMQLYMRSLPGYSRKDLFTDLVVREIYAPLGLSHTARYSRRTFGRGDPQQTFTGWGLALSRGDVALLGKFLGFDRGAIDGVQKLDTQMLDEALQRVAMHPYGISTSDPLGIRWYSHGFWARNLKDPLGCSNPTYVPAMSGYGGITVALFPPVNGNGVIYYNFSDEGAAPDPNDPADVVNWSGPAIEARKFGDFCK